MPFPETVPSLSRALAARGYETPTAVQEAVLQPGLETRDLLVSAQTGSGKTVAFGLAFAPTLIPEGSERLPPANSPMALVIAPTRELALQVQSELQWLYAETGARIVSCIGGTDARREARNLSNGVHIVVGTPGRLCDHLSRGALNLSDLRVIVMDEADEMLDLGFRDELEQLLDAAPVERRTLLFSATIAKEIANLARRFQKNAERINTVSTSKQHDDITYKCVLTAPNDIGRGIVNVLRYYESATAMLFCNTRAMVAQVQAALVERGFASVAISGEMGQNERSRAIEALRSGVARVCVATDVAARGIDIPALSLVIHANMPSEAATLLHRSGRTGRAGRKGTCVVMVPLSQRRKAERLLSFAKINNAEWESVPSADAILEQDAKRLMGDETLFAPSQAVEDALASQLAEAHDSHQLATALVRLYKSRLPSVENIRPVNVEAPAARGARDERAPREFSGRVDRMGGEWFSLAIGRTERADPKWLVPLICRLGSVTKSEIGAIHIDTDHTLFEIAPDSAERFRSCVAGADADEAKIEPASAPTGPSAPPRGPRRPR
ncbi:DEAD/DEAH box helicase, partial [Asaia astilbis]|uniref:DEAD/DEAH box helicase n=1 Tax=Asaia astilbis TaxID=610244 RepID=UPI0004724E94